MNRPSAAGPYREHAAVHADELPVVPDVLRLVERLRADGLPWLLDSAGPEARRSRFAFVGSDPYLVLRVRGRETRLERRRPVRAALDAIPDEGDPLDLVRALLPRVPRADVPVPFAGGAVGYFGYELAARLEAGVPPSAPDDLGLPDLALLFVDRLVAIDRVEGRAWAIGLGFGADDARARRAAAEACRSLRCAVGGVPPEPRTVSHGGGPPPAAPAGLVTFFQRDSYARVVEAILEEIAAGNVYQANLTHRMDLAVPGVDPLAVYRALRDLNPAPFAAYLELPELAVVSSSPERFLRVDPQGRVESRPIKGTRPRGVDPQEDAALEAALGASAKDRAENLMIVDLVRNDLGRVCRPGSVRVPELMQIEAHPTVFQMVSTVWGRLRDDRDAIDLLRASFPPGSMTGAPKLAAMRLIDRIEPVRRGVYSGALGYLDVRGGLDLSVVIRTLVLENGRAHVHAGGGIVADSDPVAEYRETLDKAAALLAALARAARPSESASAALPG